LGFAALYPTYR